MHRIFNGFYLITFITAIISCAPRHYHSCGYIQNPTFNQFGGSKNNIGDSIEIKSYIRSEMANRTEYIYENFNITIPSTLERNQKHNISKNGIIIWYAKGGQAGQIETKNAKGFVTIKEVSSNRIVLDMDLVFFNFTKKGNLLKTPDSIQRKGSLTAIKGYKLY